MTTAETPRQIAWARRRASAARTWREFAAQRAALAGLVLLGATVVVALLLPLISDQSGLDVTKATGQPLAPPDAGHWLGTDNFGRSVLLMTVWGSRVSLLVGFSAALLSVVIGTLIGITAAHFGGWVSATLLRFTDFFLVLPSLILAIALSAVLPKGVGTIIIAIGLTAWPSTARLVRAQTLTIESRPYIERAHALGGGHLHVIGRHVLPGVMPLVLANTTLVVGNAVIADATLSFLGVGDPNSVTWGLVLESALNNGAISRGAWWNVLPPGIAIVLVVLFFTLVGRGLETVFNPRLKK
ncbi:ABC transporter permease [Amycolatopsis vancoresmycina]|uniref:Dipeptide/oligopeptide/nickel ABC transporter permease n=1 Tax=Amycolatopsis vancoresmycina DSM 44592 TaxID=1292037 RepID=R1FHG2_9PSEU|nr:ABC transporter permease [Amycolatopsis vancoresmycina]EOD59002.1 dipeptide/oligopeptide/nickel ABC transporter permease [Amycolatopsis vancoresmycina DSM 44592]